MVAPEPMWRYSGNVTHLLEIYLSQCMRCIRCNLGLTPNLSATCGGTTQLHQMLACNIEISFLFGDEEDLSFLLGDEVSDLGNLCVVRRLEGIGPGFLQRLGDTRRT